MSTATIALRTRPRLRFGPALRRSRPPLTAILVSAGTHILLVVAAIVGAAVWREHQPKTYVVNLVPAVAAVGVPQGRVTPSLPPRPEMTPPAKSTPTELPQLREPSPHAMPSRERETPVLPDRTLAARTPALPRPGDKELPPVAAPSASRSAPPPTPPPLGRPSGSPQGSGALTLNVSDFPFAWYLRTIERKIQETWKRPLSGREGQEAIAFFEITREGKVRRATIEKTSGDAVYDQAALRAILDADPFPPLPDDFKEPPLRVHLGFTFRDRG